MRKLGKKGTAAAIACLLFIYTAGSFFLVSYCDIADYNFPWILYLQENGVLHMYDEWAINYPPIFPLWLNLIGKAAVSAVESMPFVFQFVMKSFGLVVNAAAVAFIRRRISAEAALAWLANLALFVNVSMWGQTDAAFGFLVVMFFCFLKEDRPFAVTAVFTVMCLLKVQGAYFCVPLLVYLFSRKGKAIQAAGCLAAGGALGYAAYLPFVIASGDVLLPIRVYLNALGYYSSVFSRNAQNIWWVLNKANVPEDLSAFSAGVLLISAVLLVVVFGKSGDICAGTLCYMFTVFMFSFDQHERYILYPIVLLFVLVFLYGKEEFRSGYYLLTLSAFLSQAAVLFVFSSQYVSVFPTSAGNIAVICSAVCTACALINLWQYVSIWRIIFGRFRAAGRSNG